LSLDMGKSRFGTAGGAGFRAGSVGARLGRSRQAANPAVGFVLAAFPTISMPGNQPQPRNETTPAPSGLAQAKARTAIFARGTPMPI
jgi:hypothetical protein